MGVMEGIPLVKYVVNYSVYNFSFLVLFSFAFTSTYSFMTKTGLENLAILPLPQCREG
jgi:hypothetical protein